MRESRMALIPWSISIRAARNDGALLGAAQTGAAIRSGAGEVHERRCSVCSLAIPFIFFISYPISRSSYGPQSRFNDLNDSTFPPTPPPNPSSSTRPDGETRPCIRRPTCRRTVPTRDNSSPFLKSPTSPVVAKGACRHLVGGRFRCGKGKAAPSAYRCGGLRVRQTSRARVREFGPTQNFVPEQAATLRALAPDRNSSDFLQRVSGFAAFVEESIFEVVRRTRDQPLVPVSQAKRNTTKARCVSRTTSFGIGHHDARYLRVFQQLIDP